MPRVVRWCGRLLLDSAWLLPRTVAGLARNRVGGLLLPLGVLALLVVLLSTLDEVRVLFVYPLTDDVTPGTWGGPTMAGAWAVHAALGLVLLPVYVGVLAGLRALATRLLARPPDGGRPGWVLPAVVVADLVTIGFLVAFVRQL